MIRIEFLVPRGGRACPPKRAARRGGVAAESDRDRKEQFQALQALGFLGNIGFIVVAAALMGYFAGTWLDEKLGTAPWLLLTCLILFLAGAALECWRVLQRFLGPHGDDRTRNPPPPPDR